VRHMTERVRSETDSLFEEKSWTLPALAGKPVRRRRWIRNKNKFDDASSPIRWKDNPYAKEFCLAIRSL
jgi:hypothetical protein